MSRAQLARQPHIVEDAQPRKQADILKRPRDSSRCNLMWLQSYEFISFKRDSSAIWPIDTREQVEHGRLTRAVRTDESVQCARRQSQRELLHCLQAAKRNPELRHLKQWARTC